MHAAVGISGIIVSKPVTKMQTGEKVKGHVDLVLSTLLHAFCEGKIFLIKLMLPHHPAARVELGPRYDQLSPSAYVKTAEFLVKILGNINFKDSTEKTALDHLLFMVSQSNVCVTHWVPVLSFMIEADARFCANDTNKESSALAMLRTISRHGFGKKNCGDNCEMEVIKIFSSLGEKEGMDKDVLQDIFQKENAFIADAFQSLK